MDHNISFGNAGIDFKRSQNDFVLSSRRAQTWRTHLYSLMLFRLFVETRLIRHAVVAARTEPDGGVMGMRGGGIKCTSDGNYLCCCSYTPVHTHTITHNTTGYKSSAYLYKLTVFREDFVTNPCDWYDHVHTCTMAVFKQKEWAGKLWVFPDVS